MSRRRDIFDPFSMEVWDPFEDYWSFPGSGGGDYGNYKASSSGGGGREGSAGGGGGGAYPRIDWKETNDAHIFRVDVPGLKRGEVRVEVEDGRVIQFSGERGKREEEEEEEKKTQRVHRNERRGRKFFRKFKLPKNAAAEDVKAAMEDGVLTVIVPKKEGRRPELKAIEICA